MPRATEYPRPSRVLVHVSDTHLVAPGERLHGVADARAHLADLLEALEATGQRPDALVFTGDLADTGDPAAYRSLRATVEPVAARMGAELVWVMGNHDDRATMRAELLGVTTAGPAAGRPYDEVRRIGGLRLVVLDSTVPGAHHGEVTAEQRSWLADVLAEPAPEGTLLLMHHPPIPCVQERAALVELRDQHLLEPVLAGSDVRAILAGHLHYSTSATFAGIPVSVATSTCYTQDLTTPHRGTQGRDAAQAVNLVHVHEHTVMHTVVPWGGGASVGRLVDGPASEAELAEAGLFVPPSRLLPEPTTRSCT